jgi:hypothetical protein
MPTPQRAGASHPLFREGERGLTRGRPLDCARASTASTLAVIFDSIVSSACCSLPPWYSTAAQITPPALPIQM